MTQYTEAIQKLYVAYFLRPAEPGGLAFWESALLRNGGDTSAINAQFSISSEYTNTYAGMNNRAIVDAIYRNLFGRAAEEGGLQYWADLLNTQRITIANVVSEVANGAQNEDLAAIVGKVKFATAFTKSLDTPEKVSLYAGEEAGSAVRKNLSEVIDANGGALAVQRVPHLIDELSYLAQNKNQSGSALVLSAENDVLQGGAARDSFTATALSLNNGDVLEGGANKDSLHITASGNYVAASQAKLSNIELISVAGDAGVVVDSRNWQGVRNVTAQSVGETTLTSSANVDVTIQNRLATGVLTLDGGRDQQIKVTDFGASSIVNIGDTIAPTGVVDLNIQGKSSVVGGKVWIHGGTVIRVDEKANGYLPDAKNSLIDIQGNSQSQAVYINQPITGWGEVMITDAAHHSNSTVGTITTVAVTGRANVTIRDNALSNLRIANNYSGDQDSKIAILNGGLTNSANTILALNLDSATVALRDEGVYERLDLSLGGQYAVARLPSLEMAALHTLNLDGAGRLELEASSLSKLTSYVQKGNAHVVANHVETLSNLNLVDTRGSTGSSTMSIDASRVHYKGGAGSDVLTLLGPSIDKTVSLGAGDDVLTLATTKSVPSVFLDGGEGQNTLQMVASSAAQLSLNKDFANATRGFQTLSLLPSQGNHQIDLANLQKLAVLQVGGSQVASTVQLNNFASDTMLQIVDSGVANYVLGNSAFASGSNDRISITVGKLGQTTTSGNLVTANGVEHIDFVVNGHPYFGSGQSLTVHDEALRSFTTSKSNGLGLTWDHAASGAVALDYRQSNASFSWQSGAITSAALQMGDGFSYLNFSKAQSNANVQLTGLGGVSVSLGAQALNVQLNNGGLHEVKLLQPNTEVTTFASLSSSANYFTVVLPKAGTASFQSAKVTAQEESLQAYANAAIVGDASTNPSSAWFTFAGDTYYVQNRHNAVSTPGFVNGTDFIVKLVGIHDLSNANMNGEANSLLIS